MTLSEVIRFMQLSSVQLSISEVVLSDCCSQGALQCDTATYGLNDRLSSLEISVSKVAISSTRGVVDCETAHSLANNM